MGYSHAWYQPEQLDPERFALVVEDVKNLLAHLPEHYVGAGACYKEHPIMICGQEGMGEPEITAERIYFNGDAENDLDHEAFQLDQVFDPFSWEHKDPEHGNRYFVFCKTLRKPYDIMVCGTLLALAHHFSDIEMQSDGWFNDWDVAMIWYMQVLGRPVPCDGPWQRIRSTLP